MYSVIVPNTGTSSSTPSRRNPLHHLVGKVSLNGQLTLYETFITAVAAHADRPCLADRPVDSVDGTAGLYAFSSYAEVGVTVCMLATGLVAEDLLTAPSNEDGLQLLGLFVKNCSAWVMAEQACYRQGAVTVPLYDTFGAETLAYIVRQTGLATVLCGAKELPLLAEVSQTCPSLKTVIVVGESGGGGGGMAAPRGALLRLLSWDDVLRAGREANAAAAPSSSSSSSRAVPPNPPSPSDVATICYTSGTTGKPKGAVISHQNLVAVSAAGLDSCMHVRSDDVYLSFLPLPHIFERIVVNSLLARGAAVGFSRGDPLKIIEDVAALQPTIFCAVPRLYNRIHDKVSLKAATEPGLAGHLLRAALKAKLDGLRRNGALAHAVWDSLVFNKIKASLGLGRVRLMLSGGAPLPASTMAFFRVLLGAGCSCHEGYGQTETTGATSLTFTGDLRGGHVGGPFPCCEVKLVDVPEMGYLHTDTLHDGDVPCLGRGEIWVRGPGVIRGYYRDPEETTEAGLDSSLAGKRWLRSGDVGMWLPQGQLAIIDRKKNMFKLAQGEYVAVEKIEGALAQGAPLVAQLFVHGDSRESQLVAVAVPDDDAAAAWYRAHNDGKVEPSLPAFARAVLAQLQAAGKAAGLKGFEQAYDVHIEGGQPWSPQNGLLTPTMKLKRAALAKRYKDEIARMYYGLNREKAAGTAQSRL